MLAFEKEHAVMRTKCTDDKVWERYKPVLSGTTTRTRPPTTLPLTHTHTPALTPKSWPLTRNLALALARTT